jgi:rhodanese-related sulfurtransferase
MFGPPAVPAVAAPDVPHDAVLLDVREDDEWEAGHIEGAVHLPLSELPRRVAEIPDADPLVVVCRSGGRSAQVVGWLAAQGRAVVNLDGGMHAWAAAGRPMVADGGTEPYVG